MTQGRRGVGAVVVRGLQRQLAEALQLVAGIEFAHAVLVDVDDEGPFGLGQRQLGGDDAQRRAQLVVADAEHDGGEIEQLAQGRQRQCLVR